MKGLKEAISEVRARKGMGTSKSKGEVPPAPAKEKETKAQAEEAREAEEEKSPLPLGISIKKAALLIALLIALTASLFLFYSLNLHVMDFVNPFALPALAAKLLSVNTIVFFVVLSATISLASLYGYRSSTTAALLAFLTVLPALGMSLLLAPSLLQVFLAFAVSVSAVSLLASRKDSLGFGGAWSLANKAMLLLMLFAFLIVLAKAELDKEAFTRSMINSATGSIPQLQQQAAPIVEGMVRNLPFDENTVKGMITRDAVEGMVSAQYDALVGALQGYFPQELGVTLPSFSSLSQEQKSKLVDETYNAFVTRVSAQLPSFREQLARSAGEAVKQPIAQLNPEGIANSIAAAKQASPIVATALDMMGVLAALGVVAAVWAVGWLVKLLSMLMTWLPAKMLF